MAKKKSPKKKNVPSFLKKENITITTKDIPRWLEKAVHLHQSGDLAQAEAIYHKLLLINPHNGDVLHLLGLLNAQGKNYQEAEAFIQQAIGYNNKIPVFYNNLGNISWELGKTEQAIDSFRRALELEPNYSDAHYNLATVLKETDHLTEALPYFQNALALNPHYVKAYNNLAETLKHKGRVRESLGYYQRALQLSAQPLIHSNYLLALHYDPGLTAEMIFTEHQQFNRLYALPLLANSKPHDNNCQPDRKLRIGYISPDFRGHSVNYFIEPLLTHHDRTQFEIYCYYNNPQKDLVTERLQTYADCWVDCAEWEDEALSNTIRTHQVDILVDLMGHTGMNRILVFARKPAPIQMAYLGYSNTTGLTAIDYRLTDEHTDPAWMPSSEMPIRVPNTYFCYQPLETCPPVTATPALKNQYVTFGSFNNYPKLSPPIIQLWMAILKALPNAKLLIKSKSLKDLGTKETLLNDFSQASIAPERLMFMGHLPSSQQYLDIYNQVDIALDSYPYNGATTTCETLWMGVPVVTLIGNTHVSRMGLSILSSLGLTELVADTPEAYKDICLKLANDIPYLQKIRAGMRERMMSSPLMDASGFTQRLESIYKELWKTWCQQQQN